MHEIDRLHPASGLRREDVPARLEELPPTGVGDDPDVDRDRLRAVHPPELGGGILKVLHEPRARALARKEGLALEPPNGERAPRLADGDALEPHPLNLDRPLSALAEDRVELVPQLLAGR